MYNRDTNTFLCVPEKAASLVVEKLLLLREYICFTLIIADLEILRKYAGSNSSNSYKRNLT